MDSDSPITPNPDDSAAKAHFERKRPGWFTTNVFNRLIAALTGRGVSVLGSRVLEVKGRSSGQPRRTRPIPARRAGQIGAIAWPPL